MQTLNASPPPMLHPHFACVQEIPGKWFVAEVRRQHEKEIAWDLHDLGMPYFLPTVGLSRIWGGRKRVRHLPVIAGYVFAAGEEAWDYLHDRDHVFNFITPHAAERERFVRQLANLQIAKDGGAVLDSFCPMRTKGRPVRIAYGRLEGVEGVVVGWDNKACEIAIEITLLGQSQIIRVEEAILDDL